MSVQCQKDPKPCFINPIAETVNPETQAIVLNSKFPDLSPATCREPPARCSRTCLDLSGTFGGLGARLRGLQIHKVSWCKVEGSRFGLSRFQCWASGFGLSERGRALGLRVSGFRMRAKGCCFGSCLVFGFRQQGEKIQLHEMHISDRRCRHTVCYR